MDMITIFSYWNCLFKQDRFSWEMGCINKHSLLGSGCLKELSKEICNVIVFLFMQTRILSSQTLKVFKKNE